MFKINNSNNNKKFYSQDLVSFPCPPLEKKYSFYMRNLTVLYL